MPESPYHKDYVHFGYFQHVPWLEYLMSIFIRCAMTSDRRCGPFCISPSRCSSAIFLNGHQMCRSLNSKHSGRRLRYQRRRISPLIVMCHECLLEKLKRRTSLPSTRLNHREQISRLFKAQHGTRATRDLAFSDR